MVIMLCQNIFLFSRFLFSENDENHTCQDEQDADAQAQRECLAKDKHTDTYSCYRFESPHDGGRGGAYQVDRNRHEEEREHRRQKSQLQGAPPLHRSVEHLQAVARQPREHQYRYEAEYQNPERELQARHGRLPLVDGNDVDGVE